MLLGIKERILIGGLLPKEGNYIEMITIKELTSKIEISSVVAKEVNLKSNGESVSWDKEKEEEIELTTVETELLKKSVDKLDRENKITLDTLDIIKKIKDLP